MSPLHTLCARALLALACLLGAAPAGAVNNDPVVLVHGFLGFGPHAVYTAGVGAISSNWDRAAELYAQIKGGCVDYGATHVARYGYPGQTQKPGGKCWAADANNNPNGYPLAFYPQWDAAHPIHLIGHSQGGTTIRALIQLLEHGSPDGDEGGGELYRGGRLGWVRSVVTISAPHNGTTLRDAVLDVLPDLRSPLRDILDNRLAHWELAPDGAREFNRWALTSPGVYYFSVATRATVAGAWCCNGSDRILAPVQSSQFQYPRDDMLPYFKLFAGELIVGSLAQPGMGSYTQSALGRVRIDASWFASDGVVNTVSMRAPDGHPVRDYDGKAVRGSWNFLGTYDGYDHFDILNWPNTGPSADAVYDRICDIIFGLD
jgi:triacylglycerol lipase